MTAVLDHARAKRRSAQEDWRLIAHSQFTAAEDYCAGHMVNKAGQAAGIDPWSLFSGPQARADAYASDELKAFWAEWPRLTVTEFERQRKRAEEIYRDELERDEASAVRQDAGTGPQDPGVRGDFSGHDVPGLAAGDPGQAEHARYRADAGRGSVVQPGRRPVNAAAERLRARTDEIRYSPQPWGTSQASAEVAVPDESQVAPGASPAVSARGEVKVIEPTALMYAPPEDESEPDEPVCGANVLMMIRIVLGYLAMWPSEEALIAASCWVAQSHARKVRDDLGDEFAAFMLPVWQYSPLFYLGSKNGGSGKSRMARLMLMLSPNGMSLAEPTKASLIDLKAEQHTIALTELDRLLGNTGAKNGGLVAVAQAGYEPHHLHSRKKNGKAEKIPLFGPVILDGLDWLLDVQSLQTLFSRAVVVKVRPGPRGYRPPRLDSKALETIRETRELCGQWMAQAVAAGIGDYIPVLPDGVGNRAAAVAEPLFAVAQWAGGEWPALMARAWSRIESATPTAPKAAERQALQSDTVAAWASAQGVAWNADDEADEDEL